MKTSLKVIVVAFVVCVTLGALPGCDSPGKLGPLQREGPAGMAMQGGEQRLWALFKQEET